MNEGPEPTSNVCSRCGDKNDRDRYFCRSCGMGLELLLAPGEKRARDVDLGAVLKAGFLGGCIGSLAGFLVMLLFHYLIRHLPAMVTPTSNPFLFYALPQVLLPFFFAAGSSSWMILAAKKMGVTASVTRTFLGGLTAIPVALVLWFSTPILGIAALALLPPVLGVRFGMGILAPIWTRRAITVFLIIVLSISSGLILLKHQLKTNERLPPQAIGWCGNDLEGGVWIVDGRGRVLHMKPEADSFSMTGFTVSEGRVTFIHRLNDRHFLIALRNGGLIEVDRHIPRLWLKRRNITGIAARGDRLFVGTDRGLFVSTIEGIAWQAIPGPDSFKNETGTAPILCCRNYRREIIIGYAGSGLFAFDPDNGNYRATGLGDPFPVHLVPGSGDDGLIVAAIGSLYRSDADLTAWRVFGQNLPQLIIPESLISSADGRCFVADRQQIYVRFPDKPSWEKLVAHPAEGFSGIAVLANGDILCGTREGLFIREKLQPWRPVQLPEN